MQDLWLKQDGKNDTITCKKGTRLDYVLVTPVVFERYKYTMSMIPESDERFEKDWNISDHRMHVVDIEENDMRKNNYKNTESIRKIHLTGIEIILQLLQMSWFPERKILGSVYILLKHSSGHKIILNRS